MSEKFEIEILPVLDSNYATFIRCRATGQVAMIDAPDDPKIIKFLEQPGWKPTLVLVTHRHWDHVDGLPKIKTAFAPKILVPESEKNQIEPYSDTVIPGAVIPFGAGHFTVLSAPGHTSGHIAFFLQEQPTLFAGDALFSLGCGRMFDGPADQMWAGLKNLRSLPDETALYCGHEYTLDNNKFALSIDPDNQNLAQHLKWVEERRAQNLPTLPSIMGFEKKNNLFLRADEASIAEKMELVGASPVDVFAALRKAKDQF